jgi:hypothetical protein
MLFTTMAAGIPICIPGIGICVMATVTIIVMTGGTIPVITGKRTVESIRPHGMITATRIAMTTDRRVTGYAGTVNPASQSGIVDVCTATHHQSA